MKLNTLLLSSLVLSSIFLTACGGSDNNNDTPTPTPTPTPSVVINAIYEITVTNATNAQPLSPPAFIIHNDGFPAWETGVAASAGLEVLAESGSPVDFISEKQSYALADAAGDGAVTPGGNISVSLETEWDEGLQITVATMLVNTNDAFTGTTGLTIGQLDAGESMSLLTRIYDAGTEENSETIESIPGPAAGGEGYNSEREASDYVTIHSGVVTLDDGLSTSVLTEAHRFDNGAMVVHIERTQ